MNFQRVTMSRAESDSGESMKTYCVACNALIRLSHAWADLDGPTFVYYCSKCKENANTLTPCICGKAPVLETVPESSLYAYVCSGCYYNAETWSETLEHARAQWNVAVARVNSQTDV